MDFGDPEGDIDPEYTGNGRVAELHVGPGQKSYIVHEDMLCEASSYFADLLERMSTPDDDDDDSIRTISLPDERPDVVDAFLHFLYIGGLPVEMPENGPLVMNLYYFSEKIEYNLMTNAIMDRIIIHHTESSSHFSHITIIGIYQNTRAGSKLRWYMAACMVFRMRHKVRNLRWAHRHAELFEVCPELFRDIFVVVCYHGMTWDLQATRLQAFLSMFTLCDFHVHGENESRCERVQRPRPQVESIAQEPLVESRAQETLLESIEQDPQIKVEDSE